MFKFLLVIGFCFLNICVPGRLFPIRPGVHINSIKIFWSSNRNGTTVSKFPPFIEHIVQLIQKRYSNYIHEDLSRPPGWDKPVYTLSPADQEYFYGTKPTTSSTSLPVITDTIDDFEYEELEDTTEKFFEIITNSTYD